RDLGPPFPAHSAFGKIAWTRDDQIWYGESMPSEIGHPGWRIMRVAAAGGVPFVVIPRINGQMVGEARFAVSPDSSQIAWTAQRGYRQEVGPRSEVWSTNLRSDPGRPR
ncbi:MAG TPA: hypothetical protein VFV98_01110, partial [Vicinamibacterales bacterium]|nr:hypothetical protein [Vicinamibacterales bacterium]